jgi:thiol-disulfide isomerase/thioredoxin
MGMMSECMIPAKDIFIKAVLALLCLFTLSNPLKAQQIKKIKIDELQSYIEKSDHPLIVNFWATYCVPCVQEIPYFQKHAEKFKKQGLELLLVSLDLPDYYPVKIVAFAKKENFTAPILWLNESNADYFCPKIDKQWSGGIPSSLFINNQTHFRKFFERQLTEPQLEENMKTLLAR